jgi:hypothetical protein
LVLFFEKNASLLLVNDIGDAVRAGEKTKPSRQKVGSGA